MIDFKKITDVIRRGATPRNAAISALLLLLVLFWVILIIDGLVFWSSYGIVVEPPRVSGEDVLGISQSTLEKALGIIERK